jgi:recombination protein RecA
MSSEKLSATKAYDQIASMFGAENIFLDPRDIPLVDSITSGSPSLDRALGVGGWPLGRIMQIAGTPSAGKTQITLIAAAKFQSLNPGNCVAFIDAEYTYDPVWAESLGIDNDRLMLIKTNSAERIFTGLVGKTIVTSKTTKHVAGLLDMIENGQEIKGKSGTGHMKSFDLSKMSDEYTY